MADVVVMFRKSKIVPMVATQEHIDMIRECVSGEVFWCDNEEEALEKGYDGEVLFIWGGSGAMPVDYCLGSKKLKWIASLSSGVNPIMESPIGELPIHLTNCKGIPAKTMALSTVGYIISFLRHFPELHRRQMRHEWNKFVDPMYEDAEDKTVVVVGAGAIGSEVGKLCKAIGMKVVGVRRHAVPMEGFDEVVAEADLPEALANGDFVVILTPLTDDTRYMFDMEKFRCMKPEAVLINIARGAVVKTEDLIQALKEGVFAGAALDALDPEPLPSDSPLWDMPNVMITPHCCADSVKYMDRAIEQFCVNLRRYEAGEPLLNEVDMVNKY